MAVVQSPRMSPGAGRLTQHTKRFLRKCPGAQVVSEGIAPKLRVASNFKQTIPISLRSFKFLRANVVGFFAPSRYRICEKVDHPLRGVRREKRYWVNLSSVAVAVDTEHEKRATQEGASESPMVRMARGWAGRRTRGPMVQNSSAANQILFGRNRRALSLLPHSFSSSRCCSMYCFAICSGAPPQDAAKYDGLQI